MARAPLLAMILTLSLGACAKPVPADDQPTPAAPDGTAVPAGPRPTAPQAAPPPTDAKPKLTVDAEGLRLIDPGSGRATPLAFGLPEDDVIATLERLRGRAARGTNGECGAGPLQVATWADGLSLLSQEGRFVGWSLDGRASGAIATMAGVGPGSSRRELEAAYAAKFMQTTIGTEFLAGTLGGVLDGAAPTSKITSMWAGTTCIFR